MYVTLHLHNIMYQDAFTMLNLNLQAWGRMYNFAINMLIALHHDGGKLKVVTKMLQPFYNRKGL